MDHADDGGGDNGVFVYMGGDQRVPRDVTHVRIHKSVKIITREAFEFCSRLVSVEMHDGVELVEQMAFYHCKSLRGINLAGVRVIEWKAFYKCKALEDVFGDKLESIGSSAFNHCTSLRNINLLEVRVLKFAAFANCKQLTDVELSEDLETIEGCVFSNCTRLRRIAMPLEYDMFDVDDDDDDEFHVFENCRNLLQVDLVGGIHKTVSSLLLDSWRNEMNDEIDRINQVLPTIQYGKTTAIQRWMGRVRERMDHYKSEHYALLKKNMTQLELALWKANLHEEEDEKEPEEQPAKKAKLEEPTSAEARDANLQIVETARKRARVTCGANLIIPHVLSFLNDEDVFPTQNYSS